jgi:hypothetical protein
MVTLEGAKLFRTEAGRKFDLIYKVEPTNVNSRKHKADMSWFNNR